MQQGLGVGCRGEIATGLAPEGQVENEQQTIPHVAAQALKLIGQQKTPTRDQACGQNQQQRRKQAAHPPGIEVLQREPPGGEILKDHPADEIAGNHQKNIDTDEAPRNHIREGVVEKNSKYCQGPEPVDLRAVGGGCQLQGRTGS